jgi:ribosome-binding factor A
MTQRTDRIDELLRQEIGEIFRRDVDDPRIGFATITDVETTPDLRHARMSVSVIGQPEERKATLAAMGRAMPFVRHELGKRLRLKRIPAFHLELDDTLERGTRVLQLLNELEEGRIDEDVPPVGESLPTPVARLPHEGDADDVPGLPSVASGKTAKPRRRRHGSPSSGPRRSGSKKHPR